MNVQTDLAFRRRLVSIAFALAMLSPLCGCDAAKPATTQSANTAPTIDVAIAGHAFKLEIADDPHKREVGLMNRKSMEIDHGMLFVFPDVAQHYFWMKNTLIPLDIAYLDEHGAVVNTASMYPNDLTSIPSDGPAKFAIEMNLGLATKIGLKAGDHIALPNLPAQ